MKQKVRKQIERLYGYLLNITSSGCGKTYEKMKACIMPAVRLSQAGQPRTESEKGDIMPFRAAILEALRPLHGGPAHSDDILVSEFQACPLEIFSSRRLAPKSDAANQDRSVEKSQKKGFDLLRVTLNLARGNIDTNAFKPAGAHQFAKGSRRLERARFNPA